MVMDTHRLGITYNSGITLLNLGWSLLFDRKKE